MIKPLLILSVTAILFASCKSDMGGNNCATSTDSLQREIASRDTRINVLLDSLKNATGGSTTTTTTTDTASINNATLGGGNENSSASTGRTFYKMKKAHTIPADLHAKYPGEFPEGSARVLTEKDLKFLSEWGLKVMLNEIYARHGMRFTDSDLQNHFSHQGWYKGGADNVDSKLSPTERRNVAFIKAYKYTPQIPA
ncbi:MAG: YARHG domain-containing protein [Flavipsychrobacter sp.]|nr:YARHG domain-containing protein [Flavipsychrobacter sp.]